MLTSCRAILFDLDGTLIDAVPDLAEAANRMLRELGEPLRSEEEVGRFLGKGLGVLVERLLNDGRSPRNAAYCEAALAVFRRHYAVTNGQRAVVYAGVRETLSALQATGMPCAVVTNKAAEFTEPLLRQLRLDQFFQCVVSGDTLPQKKPRPEPLLHACAALGVAPHEALMVGDSANDAEAARRAGIPVLLLTGGYSEGVAVDTLDCDGLLSNLAELLPMLGLSQPALSP
ncbi:phosphoglycolate phosphatase [Viridibacterium curvum]|uniref:Phosphoglycolate phosphatase n=1 Tax=Viridibacterium curvum TaxID=1101404 RepID=A0ABP9R330_9RHOO